MEIDARGLVHPEPLLKMKAALEDQCSFDETVTVLVDSREDVKKMKAFAGFSHHGFEAVPCGEYWKVRITRMCNC